MREGSDLCQNCQNDRKQKIHLIYQHIQDYPGVTVRQLSRRFDVPEPEIEQIIYTQSMGTSKYLVRTLCARCKTVVPNLYRFGKFCADCNQDLRQDLRREQEKAQETEWREQRKYNYNLPSANRENEDMTKYGLKKWGFQ